MQSSDRRSAKTLYKREHDGCYKLLRSNTSLTVKFGRIRCAGDATIEKKTRIVEKNILGNVQLEDKVKMGV